jgi:hypothetical protein
MSSVAVQESLCSSCINDRYCIYPRDPGRPIMACEEFEGYVMPPPEADHPSTPVSEREMVGEEENSREFKGLCVSCENRKTCIYPKPEGGVWRCEECQ